MENQFCSPGLPLAGPSSLEHLKGPPKCYFLHLKSICPGKTLTSMGLSGSWFRKPLLANGGNSARWGLDHVCISSHCFSLKAPMIQMPMLSPKRGARAYFGKEAYFKLKNRGSLSHCSAGFFPLCTQQKLNIL